MQKEKKLILILSVALIICAGFLIWQFALGYQFSIYSGGYETGYTQGIADSVIKILSDLQNTGYSAITYQNQTIPICVCPTE